MLPPQQRLQVKLAQKLVLTPALQQAIKLLPMTTLELRDLLTHELAENPLLDDEAEQVQANEAESESAAKEDVAAGDDGWEDADYEYFFGDYLDSYRPRAAQEVGELPPLENTLSTATSLADYLGWQLTLQTRDPQVREIGTAIIGNLDDDGYLAASVEDIAAMSIWTVVEVERVLQLIQHLDPVGVAARDLQECLLLQIRHLGLEDDPSATILRDHLPLLQSHRIQEIAHALSIGIEEVKEHVAVIANLDPKPGSHYTAAAAHYVTPDVSVVKIDDEYVVTVNDDGLPNLRISPRYRRLLEAGQQTTAETRAYVRERFRAAVGLLKSVHQRQKTIHKVATSIVKFQRDFMDLGVDGLRPLILRDVAEDIGMHESTVSRVVNNKYMDTPQGVCELKYFFNGGLLSASGENVSSRTLKQRLRRIIADEDRRQPLSDAQLARQLGAEGVALARRTIAKYREELRIPTSGRRRVVE